MIIATSLALALAFFTFVFHFFALRWLARLPTRSDWPLDVNVLALVIAIFALHLVEIALYASLYGTSVSVLGLGSFSGGSPTNAMEYLYYSGVIFTSLGLGDIYPLGHLRFITAIEALNGFLLITWSASFTFLAMSDAWNPGEASLISSQSLGSSLSAGSSCDRS
jgi:hypothetical protein